MATATQTPAPSSAPLSPSAIGRPRKLLPFGTKAASFITRMPSEDARLNILVGSVRSAKTWATMIKILALCRYQVAGQKVLTGVSKQAIYQNVLNDLFEIVGESGYSYNRQSGELGLMGAKWLVIGARDEGSEKAIRGLTVGVVVCDELVLMPRNFFQMLLSRMSPAGARLYGTTNPDSPYHWLRTEVLESKDLTRGLGGRDLWWETWTLDDNPNLGEEFKAFARRKYTGVFYQRFILGQWVLAEGAIYRDVLTDDIFYDDSSRPVGLLSRGGHVERWISCDYGTTNPCTWGDIYDDGSVAWVEREYYWDSRAEGSQKTDAQYADDMMTFVGGGDQRNWPGIIIDPSAASFRAELLARGFYVIDAENEVEDGIRRVSTALARKKIRIHRRCVNLAREMQTYSWNANKSDKGREQPIKAHDHAPDWLRYYFNTRINDWRLAA